MWNKLKTILNREFFIALLFLGIGTLYFDFVTDDYSAFSFGCAAKQFSNYPYLEYFWQGFIGYSELYRPLYNWAEIYNWIMISWLCFGFIALYLSLRFIRYVFEGKPVSFFVLFLCEIIFSFLYLENFFTLSHTRFSLMFCALGLVNLAFRERLRKIDIIGYSFLFMAGMLMRPEGALGMLLLVGVARLIFGFDFIFVVKRFLVPALLFLGLFSAIAYDWNTTDVFIKKLEPEVEYNFMEQKTIGISEMKTPQDSIKYELAIRGMWFDPKEISPEFLRSLIKKGSNITYSHVFVVLEHISQLYKKYAAFPVVTLLLLAVLLLSRQWQLSFRLALFALFSFLLLFLVDFKGLLLAGRHFLGFQLASLLISFYYYFSCYAVSNSKKMNNAWVGIALVFACFFSIHTVSLYLNDNRNTWMATADMEKAMRYIESHYKNRVVVVTNEARYCFDRHPSIVNNIYKGNTYILFDNGTYSMIPRYGEYLQELTGYGLESPEGLIQWFSDQNALYMSNHERYDLIERYFGEIYGMNVEFSDSVSINDAIGGSDYMTQDYEIRALKVLP